MSDLPKVLIGLELLLCGTFPSSHHHRKLTQIAGWLGATVTTSPSSSNLTHVIVSEVEAQNPGTKARKASARVGIHTVGLGWLLTSLAERRKVGEDEEVAKPLVKKLAGVENDVPAAEGGSSSGSTTGSAVAGGEPGSRCSGRGRVAQHQGAAAGEGTVGLDQEAQLKRERSPTPNHNHDGDQDVKPVLASATINAPHPRFVVPGDHHLIEHDGAPCSATLNLTDVKKNSNKFYIVQAIGSSPSAGPPAFFTFLHWGRIGESGQVNTLGPFGTSQEGLNLFLSKFLLKTGLDWNQRTEEPVRGKYTFLSPSSRSDTEPQSKRQKLDNPSEPACTLSSEVQTLMSIMCDQSAVERTVAKYEYDASRLPLGQLSPTTIKQGFAALRAIGLFLELKAARAADAAASTVKPTRAPAAPASERKELQRLSGVYYTLIPHVFGRATPPTIDHQDKLDNELDLLTALSSVKLTASVLSTRSDSVHRLDQQYNSLNANLVHLAPDSASVEILAKMVSVDTERERGLWRLELVDAFEVVREGEPALPAGEPRLMGWYGAQATHWAGLISHGLQTAEAGPRSGYLFGNGVYLASLPTKPASACYAQMSGGFGLMALCEVHLSKEPPLEANKSMPDAEAQAKAVGAVVTHAVGRIQPADWIDAAALAPALAGVQVAAYDRPAQTRLGQTQLLHDEWVVYDEGRVRIKYLCRVKFIDA